MLAVFIAVLVLAPVVLAQPLGLTTGDTTKLVEKTETSTALELVKYWKELSVLALLISAVLIALAYMYGNAFDQPDLKAWASVEINQVISTAIIILVLFVAVAFLDTIVAGAVEESALPNLKCEVGTPCGITIAHAYLDTMINNAHKDSRSILKQSFNYAKDAAKRSGYSCNMFILPIPCLWASISVGDEPHLILQTERLNAVLDYYNNIIASMSAQRFFVDNISFRLGPAILLVGIVARSFPFTRKVGGLLIAVAVGVIFVFPLMYIFNWFTLNVMIFGDKVFGSADAVCPAECLEPAPIAYAFDLFTGKFIKFQSLNGSVKYIMDKTGVSEEDAFDNMKKVAKGTLSIYQPGGGVNIMYSCEAEANFTKNYGITDTDAYCPQICRQLPYPNIPSCANESTQLACSMLTPFCKVYRYVNMSKVDPGKLVEADAKCPVKCRTIPPMKSNCAVFDPSPEGSGLWGGLGTGLISQKCNFQTGGFEKDCVKKVLEDDIDYCLKSSFDCRYTFQEDPEWEQPSCNGEHVDACPPIGEGDYLGNTALEKSLESCVYGIAGDSDLKLLDEDCSGCIFVENEFTFDPPVYTNCASACSGEGASLLSVSDIVKQSGEGMVGREDIKSISKMMIPAYVLPLLNILVTLMFIKTFSQILGGDIEIPGVPKVL